jgi:hypothetical protein
MHIWKRTKVQIEEKSADYKENILEESWNFYSELSEIFSLKIMIIQKPWYYFPKLYPKIMIKYLLNYLYIKSYNIQFYFK